MNPGQYYNYNGQFYHYQENPLAIDNRAFRYGDGVFESMYWDEGGIPLLPLHIDRLHRSMRLLQLEGTHRYSGHFIRQEAEALIRKNRLSAPVRIRFAVFRSGSGLYAPETNEASFLMEVSSLDQKVRMRSAGLIIDVYQEHRKAVSSLSALKTNGSLVFVLAALEKKRLGLDDVILLNQEGMICEATGSNVFIWYQNVLYTPALSEGCVDGVMRRAVIEAAKENGIDVIEAQMNPGILHLADEVFVTNAVKGMQSVLGYKKKRYFNRFTKELKERTDLWIQQVLNPEGDN